MAFRLRDVVVLAGAAATSACGGTDHGSSPDAPPIVDVAIDTPVPEDPLPPEIDKSFGTDGRGRDFLDTPGQFQMQSVIVTPNNMILVTGTEIGQIVHTLACRYTSTGARDTSWAGDGCAEGATDTWAGGSVLTAAGLIIAGGAGDDTANTSNIWRYTNAGILDATYGNAGTVTVASPPNGVAADGTGIAVVALSSTGKVGITRLDATGSVVDSGESTITGYPRNLVRRADGRFVIGANDVSGVARLIDVSADLDTFTSNDTPNDELKKIRLQPDGARLVLYRNRLTRELPGGGIDPSFGAGGTVTSPDMFSRWSSVVVLADGRIAVVGGEMPTGQPPLATLWLYTANGSLVTSFAKNGVLHWPFRRLDVPPFGAPETALDVAVAADGSLIVLGGQDSSHPHYAFVSRVLAP